MTRSALLISSIAAGLLTIGAISTPVLIQNATAVEAFVTETLASGNWTKKSFRSTGSWSIYQEDGKTFVRLSDDFSTRNAPDLKIFLSPLTAIQTNGRNATDGSVLISPLKSNKGGQVYEIPAGVDLSSYKSILIHCEAYSKLWSAADI